MKTRQAILIALIAFTFTFIGKVAIPLYQSFTNPWTEQSVWQIGNEGLIFSLAMSALMGLTYRFI